MYGNTTTDTRLDTIALDIIDESPTNPRRIFDATALDELAASIRAQGLLQPVRVRPREGGRFELVIGARRLRASKLAGASTIIATVREMTDREVREAQIIENRDRADVHPLDEADAIAALHREHRVGVEDIAARLGSTVRYVTDRLTIAEHLGAEARELFARGGMTFGAALVAARLPAESQGVLAMECGYTRREVTATEARDIVRRRVSLSLVKPPFDPSDATLPGGACAACPKRSARQPELFDDAAAPADDHCLSRTCYEEKRMAALDREIATLRTAGHTVLVGEAAKELLLYGRTSSRILEERGLVSVAGYCDADDDGRTWEKIIGDRLTPAEPSTYVLDDYGTLHRMLPVARAEELAAGRITARAVAPLQRPKTQQAAPKPPTVDDAVNAAIFDAMVKRCDEGVSDAMVAWLCRETMATISRAKVEAIAVRRGVTWTTDVEGAVTADIGVDDPLSLLCEITLMGFALPSDAVDVAESVFGVDTKAVRAEVEERLAPPKPEPKAKSAKGKKAAAVEAPASGPSPSTCSSATSTHPGTSGTTTSSSHSPANVTVPAAQSTITIRRDSVSSSVTTAPSTSGRRPHAARSAATS